MCKVPLYNVNRYAKNSDTLLLMVGIVTDRVESRICLEHLNRKESMKSVVFSLHEQMYCVLIEEIVEILRGAIITSVPGAANIIEGVINVRGNIIPVVNLHRRFGLPMPAKNKRNRIVIVQVNDEHIGLMVEAVKMVTNFEEHDVEPPHHQDIDEDLLMGFAKLEQRVVGILNLKKVLYDE